MYNNLKLKLPLKMNVEEALLVLDQTLQTCLNDIQELVFRKSWEGLTYLEIAESCGYNPNYIKDVGSKLWKVISTAFQAEVTKSNFRSVLRRQYFVYQNNRHTMRSLTTYTTNINSEENNNKEFNNQYTTVLSNINYHNNNQIEYNSLTVIAQKIESKQIELSVDSLMKV